MEEYKFGSVKREAFENTITNMKVLMQAMCRVMEYKKRLRIVIEYDPQNENVITTIQAESASQLGLDQYEADPIWTQRDPTQLDKHEGSQRRQKT